MIMDYISYLKNCTSAPRRYEQSSVIDFERYGSYFLWKHLIKYFSIKVQYVKKFHINMRQASKTNC